MHFEKFSYTDLNCHFKIKGVPTINAPSYLYPLNYNNITSNYLEKIPLGSYPQLNFKKDNFGDWLIYNGVSNQIATRGGLTSMGLGAIGLALALTPAGVIAGGLGIATMVGRCYIYV